MRIIDPVKNSIGLGYDTARDTVGIVFKTSEMLDNRPLLGLIIPKFMLGYEFKNGDQPEEKEISIDNSKCINDASEDPYWDSSATIKNYILVRPLLNQNQSMPIYTQGDRVFVTMIDEDIKTLAFLPYSINRLGQRATDEYKVVVPGNPEENTALTEENVYIFRMDSRPDNQFILIQTSNKNGETVFHTIKIDSKNGIITITDNEDLSWVMDTQNDSVTTKTSGTSVEQIGDKINMRSDTTNIYADSKIHMETDKFELQANTIENKASDTKYEYDNFKQTSTNGKWLIDREVHEGMAASFKENTFHTDAPIIGLNGLMYTPGFFIGPIPNITTPPPHTTGMCGPSGSMIIQTDPQAVPLARFPEVSQALMACASGCAAVHGDGGAALSTVSGLLKDMSAKRAFSS